AHGIDLAGLIIADQDRVHLLYVLRYQTKLRGSFWINLFFIAETYRPQRQDRFAGFVHRLNRFLKPGRGGSNPQLAICVYYYLAASHGRPEDARDKGVFLRPLLSDPDGVGLACHAKHISANIDIITPRGEILAGITSQGNIVRSRRVFNERGATTGCVVSAGRVVREREQPVSRVIGASRIVNECLITAGCIAGASGVAIDRLKAKGCVTE